MKLTSHDRLQLSLCHILQPKWMACEKEQHSSPKLDQILWLQQSLQKMHSYPSHCVLLGSPASVLKIFCNKRPSFPTAESQHWTHQDHFSQLQLLEELLLAYPATLELSQQRTRPWQKTSYLRIYLISHTYKNTKLISKNLLMDQYEFSIHQ